MIKMKKHVFKKAVSLSLVTAILLANSVAVSAGTFDPYDPTVPPPPVFDEHSFPPVDPVEFSRRLDPNFTGGAGEVSQEVADAWSSPEVLEPLLEERREWRERMGLPSDEEITEMNFNARSSWTSVLSVPYRAQEQFNTCGPAVARMIVGYFRGWIPTESEVYSSPEIWPMWSTRHTTFLTHPNDLQNRNVGLNGYLRRVTGFTYIPRFDSTQAEMSWDLTRGIRDDRAPSVIGLHGRRSQNFPVDTGGAHFVVGYAVWGNGEQFAVMDPGVRFGPPETFQMTHYVVPARELHTAYWNVRTGYAY